MSEPEKTPLREVAESMLPGIETALAQLFFQGITVSAFNMQITDGNGNTKLWACFLADEITAEVFRGLMVGMAKAAEKRKEGQNPPEKPLVEIM